MNTNYIMVFDVETTSVKPESCELTEFAAKVINPKTLKWVKGSEFSVELRPENIDDPEWAKNPDREKTINWCSQLWGMTPEQVVEKWKSHTISEKQGWQQFLNYTKRFRSPPNSKNKFNFPIPAGYNIIGFDIPICNRLIKKYKTDPVWHPQFKYDRLDHTFAWFNHKKELTTDRGWPSYAFDVLRKYLGLPADKAHTAAYDVEQEGEYIMRLMKLYRNLFDKISFKGSFNE